MVAHLQVIRIGRRVHGPQRAVDVERVYVRVAREALRIDALDDVARDDVLDDPLDVGKVGLAIHVRPHGRIVRGRPHRVGRRNRLPFGQPRDHLVDPELRLAVSRLRIAVEPGMGDDADHVLEMIEHQDRVDELEQRFGQPVDIPLGRRDARLEVPDRLVGEVADRAAAERRQIRVGHQLEPLQLGLDQLERILRTAAGRPHHAVRLGSDEGEAARPLAAFDGFEQERVIAPLDLEEGGDGGFQIREHLAVDGGEIARAGGGDLLEFVEARRVSVGCGHGPGLSETAPRSAGRTARLGC